MRARIAATNPACHICGKDIDLTLPHLDPMAFVIDHVIPLAKGGDDALHNIKAAHRQPKLQLTEAGTHSRTNHSKVKHSRVNRAHGPTGTSP